MFFLINLHFCAGIFCEETPVAGLDIKGMNLPVLQDLPFPHGDNFAFHGLFFGRVGNNNAALGLLRFFNPSYNYPVLKWSDLHAYPLLSWLTVNRNTWPFKSSAPFHVLPAFRTSFHLPFPLSIHSRLTHLPQTSKGE